MQLTSKRFQVAHALGGGWYDLTRSCLDDLSRALEGTNLGFVYVSKPLDRDLDSIIKELQTQTKIENWVGTVGFGICVSGQELFDLPAIAVMVGTLPEESFRIVPAITSDNMNLSSDLIAWSKEHNPTIGIVHADPRAGAVEETLRMLQDQTGCFLVGGLSSSSGFCGQIAGGCVEGGVSGILFGSEISAQTALTQGCSPIGNMRFVTAAEGNIIQALDNRPAFDVFKEDIGDLLAHNLSRAQGYVHVALPVAGSDTGDYVVRNLLGVSPEEGSIAVGQYMTVGDRMMFVRRDGTSATSDLERMAADLHRRRPKEVRAAFYFSCVARGPNLFGEGSRELKAIESVLGELPLVGFFANGEISNNRLYGYTGVLTLIG
jgi:small ligand-binding sensory domain FIST